MPELRRGMVIEFNKEHFYVIDFQHTMLGRGTAHIKARLKNIRTGQVLEKTMRESDTFNEVKLIKKTATFSYSRNEEYYFYLTDSYEEIVLKKEAIKDALSYLKENLEVNILYLENEPLGIELPNFIELKVVETEPGFKGNTVSAGSKPAKLETGKVIQVPLFIQVNDVIRIDTRTDKYIGRAS